MAYVPAIDVSQCVRGEGTVHERTGYLRKSRFNKVWYAHRLAYSDANGGIPEGYHVHHLCDNKLCINPKHLVALTPAEHKEIHTKLKSLAYYAQLKTCKYGHEFDCYDGRQRVCLTCKRRIGREWARRNVAMKKELQNV